LPVVLCGCKTLREEHRLRVFQNRVLRRIFGPKVGENCIMRSFITCNWNDKVKGDEMGR
jgi:hypothetical protein